MDIEKIKQEAVKQAKKFIADEENFKFGDEEYSPAEWFLIMSLAQTYYNLIKGIYTREQTKTEQNEKIKAVIEHEDIFEDADDGQE